MLAPSLNLQGGMPTLQGSGSPSLSLNQSGPSSTSLKVDPTSTFDQDTQSRYQYAVSKGIAPDQALQAASQYQQQKAPAASQTPDAPQDTTYTGLKGLLLNKDSLLNLSTLGSIGGGILGGIGGTLAAPFTAGVVNPIDGAIAGSGLGGAGGEALREKASGQNLNGKDIAIQGALGSIADGGGQLVGAGLKAAAPIASKYLSDQAERLALGSLGITKAQSAAFAVQTKSPIGQFVADNDLIGKPAEYVSALKQETQDSYDAIARKSGIQIPVSDLDANIRSAIAPLKSGVSTDSRAAAQAIQDEYESVLKNMHIDPNDPNATIDIGKLTDAKSEYQRQVNWKNPDNINQVKGGLADAFLKTVNEAVDPQGAHQSGQEASNKIIDITHRLIPQENRLGSSESFPELSSGYVRPASLGNNPALTAGALKTEIPLLGEKAGNSGSLISNATKRVVWNPARNRAELIDTGFQTASEGSGLTPVSKVSPQAQTSNFSKPPLANSSGSTHKVTVIHDPTPDAQPVRNTIKITDSNGNSLAELGKKLQGLNLIDQWAQKAANTTGTSKGPWTIGNLARPALATIAGTAAGPVGMAAGAAGGVISDIVANSPAAIRATAGMYKGGSKALANMANSSVPAIASQFAAAPGKMFASPATDVTSGTVTASPTLLSSTNTPDSNAPQAVPDGMTQGQSLANQAIDAMQQGGHMTQDQYQALMSSDAFHGGRNQATITAAYQAGNPTAVQGLGVASNATNTLSSLFDAAKGAQGPIMGSIENALSNTGYTAKSVKSYNDQSTALGQEIISQIYGTAGTSGDRDQILNMIPKITDSAQTAASKMDTLRSLIQQRLSSMGGSTASSVNELSKGPSLLGARP